MIMTLTMAEATKMIQDAMRERMGVDVDVKILSESDLTKQFRTTYSSRIAEIEGNLNGHNKIGAIKALRTATRMGLHEAKAAIENWGAYLEACDTLGRWAITNFALGSHNPRFQ
jgi:ribosomal protein L7/L12